jgi:hypothetical protein
VGLYSNCEAIISLKSKSSQFANGQLQFSFALIVKSFLIASIDTSRSVKLYFSSYKDGLCTFCEFFKLADVRAWKTFTSTIIKEAH